MKSQIEETKAQMKKVDKLSVDLLKLYSKYRSEWWKGFWMVHFYKNN